MNDKIIIITTLGALLISSVFLSAVEKRQADLDSKNIWMVYFTDPKNDSLDFSIENHSRGTAFHFEISADKNKISEGDVIVANGETRTVPVSLNSIADKKIIIDVTATDGKKEIYKNF